MKSKLNQYSDLELQCKITVKTSPDSQNKKSLSEHAWQYEHSEHERYLSQRRENSHEGAERKKDSKPAHGSVCLLRLYTGLPLFGKGRSSTIMKTQASTYALNTMRFNNKLSFLSLVSSSMLIRRECDWHDNMSIMGVVRLNFL